MRIACSIFLLLHFCLSVGQSRYSASLEAYEEALVHFRNQEYGLANELVLKAIAIQPSAEAYYLNGLIMEREGRDLRAVSAFEAAVKIEPAFREAIFQKAILYLKNGDPNQAINDFTSLIKRTEAGITRTIYFEIDPMNDQTASILTLETSAARVYYYRGQAYQKVGDKQAAKEDYEQAIALDQRPEFYNARALLYEQLSNYAEAIIDLKTAISLDSMNQLAWFNLLRLDASIQVPESLLGGEMNSITSLLAARAHEKGNYEEALRYYHLALDDESRRDPLTLINRGRVLLKNGNYADARRDFQEARTLEPERTETLYLIGNSFFFQKMYEQALAYYNQYLILDPQDATIWYNGALAYLKLDRDEEACHYLNRASKLGMNEALLMKASTCQED